MQQVLKEWTEAEASWQLAIWNPYTWYTISPPIADSTIHSETIVPAGTTGWIELDVTRLTQKFISGEVTNNGYFIGALCDSFLSKEETTGAGDGTVHFVSSSQHSTVTQRPKLTLTIDDGTTVLKEKVMEQSLIISMKEKILTIISPVSDTYTFEIFSVSGRRLQKSTIQLAKGENTIEDGNFYYSTFTIIRLRNSLGTIEHHQLIKAE